MKIFKQNCLECKYCIKKYSHGFECDKKNFSFDYNRKTVIRGAICAFYEKEVIKNE